MLCQHLLDTCIITIFAFKLKISKNIQNLSMRMPWDLWNLPEHTWRQGDRGQEGRLCWAGLLYSQAGDGDRWQNRLPSPPELKPFRPSLPWNPTYSKLINQFLRPIVQCTWSIGWVIKTPPSLLPASDSQVALSKMWGVFSFIINKEIKGTPILIMGNSPEVLESH